MALGDTLVKIAGKQVKLSDLARGGEVLTFDGFFMTYKRANKSIGQMSVFHEDYVKRPDLKSLTQQSFKAETDINFIMDKYIKTGLAPIPVGGEPIFGDFTSGADYSEQQRNVADFATLFELLPPAVRTRFDNDAAKCIDFALQPENEAECIALGLLPQKPVVPPASPSVGTAAPASPAGSAAPASPVPGAPVP